VNDIPDINISNLGDLSSKRCVFTRNFETLLIILIT